ncbi:MAG: DUF4349 domain-containing protein [Pirellulales bacterium]
MENDNDVAPVRWRWTILRWLFVLLLSLGCGQNDPKLPDAIAARTSLNSPGQSGGTADDTGHGERALAARRVIRRGELNLEVEDFEPLPKRIEDAVQEKGGFVFASNISGSGKTEILTPDSRSLPSRSGTWTLRVPTERFSALLDDLRKLGNVRSTKTSAEDVTADYADLESRIRNKQREEDRLLKLLTDATGRLEEVLTIERELTRVRGEIETAQGRAAMLKDLTDLATLVVAVVEAKPLPAPPLPPTYLEKLVHIWKTSWERLIVCLQEASFILVGAIPWLSLPVIVFISCYVVHLWVRARYATRGI